MEPLNRRIHGLCERGIMVPLYPHGGLAYVKDHLFDTVAGAMGDVSATVVLECNIPPYFYGEEE